MVLGAGVDIVDIERIRRLGERYGDRFVRRVFTEGEWRSCQGRRDPWPSLAARWAAKEAGMKSLGLGMEDAGWRDFEVVTPPGQKPQLALSGRAAQRARELGVSRLLLSLSHERAFAVAYVLATAGDGGPRPLAGGRGGAPAGMEEPL